MIISKDLFIFGEHIFSTILPEGGTTTTATTTTQSAAPAATTTLQTQQTLPTAALGTTTRTTSTIIEVPTSPTTTTTIKTCNNKMCAAAAAAAENVVDPFKIITTSSSAATAATTTTTTLNTNPTTTTITTGKVREQETVAVGVVVAVGNDVDKVRNYKNNEFNFINRKEEAATATPTAKNADDYVKEKEEAEKINILKVKEAELFKEEEVEEADAEETEGVTTTKTAAAAAKEPLVKTLTKIKTTTTTDESSSSSSSSSQSSASSVKLLVGEQLQPNGECRLLLEERSFNEVPQQFYIPAAAVAAETTTATPLLLGARSPTEKIIKTSNSADLSRKMRKVMLGNNNARSDHAMVTFPFISEQHRTLQLTFQNINVVHNDRQILSDVSGLVSPGEVLAIMGPSGCGKTTLLDCLSGQRRIDGGSVYLNREPLSKKWRRKICYVLQEEIFFTGLTLRETVMYTALLRLPERMPREEKMKLVDRILEALELKFCQQTKFGDYLNRGLSGGEKKRANIACELLTNPLLMLLDEPTSGLDSHSAISLMKVLKRYAIQEQKTVVITVHQPSSQMFHMFDKLLLLYAGRTAYFGDVKNIYRYFEDIGVAIKPHYNPADFVLEQIKSYPEIREKLFIAAKESHGNFLNRNCINLNTNSHHQTMSNGIGAKPMDAFSDTHGTITANTNGTPVANINSTSSASDKICPRDTLITDIMHNYYQNKSNHHNNHNHNHIKHEDLVLMNNRHNCADVEAGQQLWCAADSQSNFSSGSSDCHQYESAEDWLNYPTRFHTQFRVLSSRNFKEAKPRMLSKLNWFQTIGLALMAGAIWFQIPRTEEFLHDLQGWMFFSQTYWMLFALFGALNSFPSEREVISKERRSGAYRLSAYYLAKMFGELPLVVTLPTVYLMISYPMLGCTSFKLFFLMLVFLLLNTIVAQSVGFFIGACCMDMNVSITLSALYTLATQLFGGYLSSRIPEGLSWVRYTSMIHYAYQNMQILEFREGPAIRCGGPSSYEICKSNSTIFIPYQDLLRAQDSTSPLWLNTLVLVIFFLVFRSLGYAVLRFVRCPKT